MAATLAQPQSSPPLARLRQLLARHAIGLSPVLCLLALGLALLGEWLGWPERLVVSLFGAAYLAGGLLATQKGLASLRVGQINVDLLMVLAAIGAGLIGQWQEGAILLFLFSLSNALQEYALERSRRAISGLLDLRPDEATVLIDGREQRWPVETVEVGRLLLVRPGERLPLDGKVVEGRTSIDQAPITGESVPVTKQAGDLVFAGTINQAGAITVQVTKLAGQSTLSRIIALVEEAQANQAPTQRWIDAFEQRYALAVIGMTLLAIIVPPLLGDNLTTSFYRAMTLLVVASPCALVISTPAAVLSAIANAARNGILFKGGVYLEAMADLKTIAFDKTGTLTSGRLQLTDVVPFDGQSANELLRLAASLERHSEHPIARTLVKAAGERSIELSEPSAVQAVPGRGLYGEVDGRPVRVGQPGLLTEAGLSLPPALIASLRRLEREGKTAVVVGSEHCLGLVAMADQPRLSAPAVIERLRRLGINHLVMLTGDNWSVAEKIGRQLSVTDIQAELLPEQKQQVVAKLVQRDRQVAMIGDGVNDAPALATATIGVAMGAAGTDVALETADVVLMSDDLNKLAYAIDLSRRTRAIVIQNLAFSLLVIAVLIAATLLGTITLPFGVLGHEGSTVLVVLNSLRLLVRRESP